MPKSITQHRQSEELGQTLENDHDLSRINQDEMNHEKQFSEIGIEFDELERLIDLLGIF